MLAEHVCWAHPEDLRLAPGGCPVGPWLCLVLHLEAWAHQLRGAWKQLASCLEPSGGGSKASRLV